MNAPMKMTNAIATAMPSTSIAVYSLFLQRNLKKLFITVVFFYFLLGTVLNFPENSFMDLSGIIFLNSFSQIALLSFSIIQKNSP